MGTSRYATIGFATVYRYYAYPQHIRPRIAQFLILPPFRRMGLGTHLLQAIYREYISRNEVKDITGKMKKIIEKKCMHIVNNYLITDLYLQLKVRPTYFNDYETMWML